MKLATAWLPHLPWYAWGMLVLLAGMTLAFFFYFVVPACRIAGELNAVIRALTSSKDPRDVGGIFEPFSKLKHLWTEYRETLHEERALNPQTGMLEVVALRATVPAETFFTDNTVVNTPVHAEFFKHLPGIFTGIGIIGTFLGLIAGLRAFKITDDAMEVRGSLEYLLHGVQEAFVVSVSAITLAMLITFVEKVVLVRLYRKVQQLTESIDERYKAGVGEEYLARLVGATEEAASQSKILKDALVGDLKTILTEISEKQIAAFSTAHTQLAQHISESVSGQLKQPLERLALATESVRGDQAAAVQQLMADLLARFADRMETMLGGQVAGVQQMQQRMIEALSDAVNHLQQMSATVAGAGQRAGDALIEKLELTLHKLDQRQLVTTEEMRKFVQEIRGLIGQTQTESHQQIQKLLSDISAHSSALVTDISRHSQSAAGAINTQVEQLSAKLAAATEQMASCVGKLESVTTDAIALMNAGAQTLAGAAGDFARAGQGVTSVMNQAQGIAGQLVQSATSLSNASHAVETLLVDYRTTRDAVSHMLSTVQQTLDAARREASLTENVLQRLNASAERLAVAQKAADEYLQQVTDVLATSHEQFAEAMNRTLNAGNKSFIDSVSSATKMLSETIQELDSALSNASGRPRITA